MLLEGIVRIVREWQSVHEYSYDQCWMHDSGVVPPWLAPVIWFALLGDRQVRHHGRITRGTTHQNAPGQSIDRSMTHPGFFITQTDTRARSIALGGKLVKSTQLPS